MAIAIVCQRMPPMRGPHRATDAFPPTSWSRLPRWLGRDCSVPVAATSCGHAVVPAAPRAIKSSNSRDISVALAYYEAKIAMRA
jgi:hypothetical protein